MNHINLQKAVSDYLDEKHGYDKFNNNTENTGYISKEKAFLYLKEFANEYRKLNRNAPAAEIIIVGGGSILLNYGFRDSTQDFDVIIHSMRIV